MDTQLAVLRQMGATLRERATLNEATASPKSSAIDVGERSAAARAKGEPPLFHANELNRAIISKVVAPKSAELLLRPHQLATKILVPYEDTERTNRRRPSLNRPGRYFLYGQRFFDETLENYIFGGMHEKQKADDLRILAALNAIPSLDSFLVRDKFESCGIPAGSCYTGITAEEWWSMRGTIMEEFRPMAQRAFGAGHDLEAKTSALVDKIWDASDTVALAPLTQALQLNPSTAPDVYHAWKGIIYYKQQYKQVSTGVSEVVSNIRQFSKLTRGLGARVLAWDAMEAEIRKRLEQLNTFFRFYDMAYSSIWRSTDDVSRFVDLLRNGPDFFYLLGSNIAALDHVGYQNQLLRRFTHRAADFAEEAYDSMAGVLFQHDLAT